MTTDPLAEAMGHIRALLDISATDRLMGDALASRINAREFLTRQASGLTVEPSQSVEVGAGAVTELGSVLAEKPWRELLEKDDRTSPSDYPDMCLVTFDELSDFLVGAQTEILARIQSDRDAVIEECAQWHDNEVDEMNSWGGPPVGICQPYQHQACAKAIRALKSKGAGQ